MRKLLVLPIALVLGLAVGTWSTVRADDPPPDPLDCPFCGGDPELHQLRLQALAVLGARVMQASLW